MERIRVITDFAGQKASSKIFTPSSDAPFLMSG